MAVTRNDVVYSGILAISETTVLTVATGSVFVIKGFWVSNSASYTKNFAIKFDDKRFAANCCVLKNDTIIQSDLNIPIMAGKTIKVSGEDDTSLDYYVWGIEEVTS